jgi:hypothetical protein
VARKCTKLLSGGEETRELDFAVFGCENLFILAISKYFLNVFPLNFFFLKKVLLTRVEQFDAISCIYVGVTTLP